MNLDRYIYMNLARYLNMNLDRYLYESWSLFIWISWSLFNRRDIKAKNYIWSSSDMDPVIHKIDYLAPNEEIILPLFLSLLLSFINI